MASSKKYICTCLFGLSFWFGLQSAPCQNKTSPTQLFQKIALVIGVSSYMDPGIPDLKIAHRDAELFAAWLQTTSGGKVPAENILLLTNDQATADQVGRGLDWLITNIHLHTEVLVFFSGYTNLPASISELPTGFLLNDTPSDSLQMQGFKLLEHLAKRLNLDQQKITCIINSYPLQKPTPWQPSGQEKKESTSFIMNHQIILDNLETTTHQRTIPEVEQGKISLNYLLLDGLLGLADLNSNGSVSWKEIDRYLERSAIPKETCKGRLFLLANYRKKTFGRVFPDVVKPLSKENSLRFPTIIQLETSPKEIELLRHLSEKNQNLFIDFIIAIKLGRLLDPHHFHAKNYHDSLQKIPALAPIHKELKRKFAAALQDEAQQAINAYLRNDPVELSRRIHKNENFRFYPRYLQLSIDLLGSKNFMVSIMEAKKYYFLGLNERFDGENSKDTIHFHKALEYLKTALEYEKDAAFIHNELGNNYLHLGRSQLASKHYARAMKLSPNWSIPYSNMAILMTLRDNRDSAYAFGLQALQLSPYNVFSQHSMGLVYLQFKDLKNAEKAFKQVLQLQPDYEVALYNLACVKALQKKPEKAFEFLEKALLEGFADHHHFSNDDQLASLRSDPKFYDLAEKMRNLQMGNTESKH